MRGRGDCCSAAILVGLLMLALEARAESPTLKAVRSAGFLTCGVVQEDAEYSTEDDHGSRGQFDNDICTAIAIASLGPGAAVKISVFLDSATAMAALRAGKVEVVASLSASLGRAAGSGGPGIHVTRPVLYDGVGFLVPRASGVLHARELAGHKICFLAETNVELSLQAWSAKQHVDYLPFPFQEEGEMEAAYITGNCVAIAGDITRLVSTRSGFGSIAKDYLLLPEVISNDSLAAATSFGDSAWSAAVDAIIEALNADDASRVKPPSAYEHLRDAGVQLGLKSKWIEEMIQSTGDLGAIFTRTYGPATMQALPRGLD